MNLLHKDMVEQFCMHEHDDFMQLIPQGVVTLLQTALYTLNIKILGISYIIVCEFSFASSDLHLSQILCPKS